MKASCAFLLITFFLSFAHLGYSEPIRKDAKIAIIGAGASGLTAAYELKQKGYTHVTVFEKESRVGGKVYSIVDGGQVFELGAIWASANYPIVEELAQHVGVTLTPEKVPLTVLTEEGRVLPIMDFPLSQHSIWVLLHNYVSWRHVQKKFGYLRETGAFFTATDPDLTLPFMDFAKKYRIEALAEGFRPFWVACGYGYYEEVPSLYVLKLMLDGMDLTFGDVLRQAFHIGPPIVSPLRLVREGFQEIWIRLAAELPDIRLGQAVEKIVRKATPDGYSIEITTDGRTEVFDRVIISVDPQRAASFVDFSPEEAKLFANVHSYRYVVHMFEGSVMNNQDETLIFPNRNGTRDRQGHVIALLRRNSNPPLWSSLQLYSWEQPIETATDLLYENLEELSIVPGPLHRRLEWAYFPHVDREALQDGFYQKAALLQGKLGTYWVGGVWNFETVEATAAYARTLVNQSF